MTTTMTTATVPATGIVPQLFLDEHTRALVRLALAEDIGRGDVTTLAIVPPDAVACAHVLQKEAGVVCGLPLIAHVFAALDPAVRVTALVEEGSWSDVEHGARRPVARLEGPAQAILSGERTALNFLQRLSGVATLSRRAAELVADLPVVVLDTRKTTPGQRVLEKYAVCVGGGHNHRAGLDDGILIKENHIRAAGGITAAVRAARAHTAPMQLVEVEVTSLEELDEAIAAGAHVVLVDNAGPDALRMAVARANGRVRLEASGGVTLDTLVAVARSGVDYVSLGALTHSAPAIDFSLDFGS